VALLALEATGKIQGIKEVSALVAMPVETGASQTLRIMRFYPKGLDSQQRIYRKLFTQNRRIRMVK